MTKSAIYAGDCIHVLKDSIEENSIDLIFTDPPFNIGKKYHSHNDNMSYDEYLEWSYEWIKLSIHSLKEHGSMYIVMGDEFVSEINIILKQNGMFFRNWIIWYYTFGQNQRKKFSRSHTHILYFTKHEKEFVFNDKDIRIPSKRQTVYKDKRANPLGKIPDDVFQVSRLCGTFNERIKGHPCQMPEQLVETFIKASSHEGDIILDPFGGTGTTAAVAKKLKREFIIIEESTEYISIIQERLKSIP